ncbi:MAG: sodium:calcium antiporter [Zetaproteobacteria bacterium]|nr:MAG: sodium:calcium antiporter [Zetaproteobacteria bacterium]
MIASLALLLFALALVFVAAQVFTNALEHLGERLGVSEGVTGSIFAAVGTAMPETIVPIVAIVAGGASVEVNHAVGLGAILGAPFMLGTLSLGLMGVFAAQRFGWRLQLTPEPSGVWRDVRVFLAGYGLAALAAFLPASWHGVRLLVASVLLVSYFLYLMATIRASEALVADGHGTESDEALYAARWFGDALPVTLAQLMLGLFMLIIGAKLFVAGAESLSSLLGVAALLVSLLIVPVATELPEKVNSILWIRRRKDTLAFGNITGAMVFQGTVIPAIGMLLLPWHVSDAHAVVSILLALGGTAWLGFMLRRGCLRPVGLMGNVLLYLVFVVYLVM